MKASVHDNCHYHAREKIPKSGPLHLERIQMLALQRNEC
jgi:hypothetical protein